MCYGLVFEVAECGYWYKEQPASAECSFVMMLFMIIMTKCRVSHPTDLFILQIWNQPINVLQVLCVPFFHIHSDFLTMDGTRIEQCNILIFVFTCSILINKFICQLSSFSDYFKLLQITSNWSENMFRALNDMISLFIMLLLFII